MIERSDFEVVFSDAVEEMRRRIVHRKLTAELNSRQYRSGGSVGRSKAGSFSQYQQTESMDGSLGKLVELAKDKIKLVDFTPIDKANLVEIFVMNQQILLKMCDLIFPGLKLPSGNNNAKEVNHKNTIILNSLQTQTPSYHETAENTDIGLTEKKDNQSTPP